jgi:hypothetical protein
MTTSHTTKQTTQHTHTQKYLRNTPHRARKEILQRPLQPRLILNLMLDLGSGHVLSFFLACRLPESRFTPILLPTPNQSRRLPRPREFAARRGNSKGFVTAPCVRAACNRCRR